MKKYECLVVDDEPLAIDLMKSHIDKVPGLVLNDAERDAVKALDLLKKNIYDLVFLDIQMPELTGMDILDIQPHLKNVVITTAYRNYAVESYNFDVLDYLVKPIAFNRFMKSVNRFFERVEISSPKNYIFVNENRKKVRVELGDILYINSQRDYVHIETTNRKIVVRTKISELLKILPTNNFVRIHQSFIVNKNKITAVSQNGVDLGKVFLPISRAYSHVFDKIMR
jgi:DNA-binding LytR/AlgR family response regulator